MKKMLTLALVIVMLFACSITSYAYEKDPVYSPSGKPVVEEGKEVATAPPTGENDMVLYGLGAAAAVLASGAVVIKKRELDV